MKNFKGSQRCILQLIELPGFVDRINRLIMPVNAVLTTNDKWMPIGLNNSEESELNQFLNDNFPAISKNSIANWWLAVRSANSRTPNWDFLSTCTINGSQGLLLVEAKAHVDELNNESKGKQLAIDASDNSKRNHVRIAEAIEQANLGISQSVVGISISRDKCYQLSNRIAHAWWLACNGIPVVLMYLGFLNVSEMDNGKENLFKSDSDWQTCFFNHAKNVGVDGLVDKWVNCGSSAFITIVKSI